jgi:hypothetical protein
MQFGFRALKLKNIPSKTGAKTPQKHPKMLKKHPKFNEKNTPKCLENTLSASKITINTLKKHP